MKHRLVPALLLCLFLAICVPVFVRNVARREETPDAALLIRFSEAGTLLEYAGQRGAPGDGLPGIGTERLNHGAVRLTLGEISVLLAGEDGFVPDVPATVLVCGCTLTKELLAAVAPDYAIIRSGAAPEEALLRLLDGQCRRVLRQDLQGCITLRTDGESVHLETERAATSREIFPYRDALSLERKEIDYQYVLNLNSKAFHLPDCPSVEQMKEENRRFSSETREQLLEMGYHPCGGCRP